MFKYKIAVCLIILLQCIVGKCFGQNNMLVLKNGVQIIFQDKLDTKKIKKQNYYTINDTLVKVEDVNYYYLDSIVHKNFKDKFFARQQSDGAINVYTARGDKYFSVGDSGQIHKLNYTNLFYEIKDDKEALDILMQADRNMARTKQLFLASGFAMTNGIFALSTNDVFINFNLTNRTSPFKVIYLVTSGFVGAFSAPVFFVSGVIWASKINNNKLLVAVREYNRKR